MTKFQINAEKFSLLAGQQEGTKLVPDDNHRIRLRALLPDHWASFSTAVVDISINASHQIKCNLSLCAGSESLLTLFYAVLPHCHVQIPFPLNEQIFAANCAFLPPQPGVYKGGMKGRAVRPEEISHVEICVQNDDLAGLEFAGLTLKTDWKPQNVEGSPLVDSMGQSLHLNWPGKTQSTEVLDAYLRSELKNAETDNQYPVGWSRWGGWLEKKFEATGWFRSEHDGRRWWLVDPDGYAFFSNGMCYGHRTGIYALADRLETLYTWLPPHDRLYQNAWCTGDAIPQYVVRNGLDAARKRVFVNFPRVNMMRIFGEDWLNAWITINAARMHRWGINTLGVGVNDYTDEATHTFLARSGIPFVITFKYFALTKECIFRDFPDVFSEAYERAAQEMAERELAPWRNAQGLIGYFVTNEPEWLMLEGVNLAEKLLQQSGATASKQAMITYLKEQYTGGIELLNAAWNTAFISFDDLLTPVTDLPATQAAKRDLAVFHDRLVNQYGEVVSRTLKAFDPNHLNLGMRYHRPSEKTLCSPLRYFNVFSFNCYGSEPATSAAMVGRHIDLPMMVGEWQFGAQDSGLDSWSLYYTATQDERAQAVRYYLEQSTQEPHLTGIHYFEYSDQPYLGRFDGESHNIGLIDVCNRPYPLVVKAFREFAQQMYPMLDGRIQPQARPVPVMHNP